jgi:hypothetical protein
VETETSFVTSAFDPEAGLLIKHGLVMSDLNFNRVRTTRRRESSAGCPNCLLKEPENQPHSMSYFAGTLLQRSAGVSTVGKIIFVKGMVQDTLAASAPEI